MKKRHTLYFLFGFGLALSSCFGVSHRTEVLVDPLLELSELMTGTFTSAEQAQLDTNYYDITLNMWPVWKEQRGSIWLYVEQSLSSDLAAPYRQRMYQLKEVNDSTFASAVFEIPRAERFIQAKDDSALFAMITPDSLITREGCTVFLEHVGYYHYVGSTHEADCKSDFRGAAYATSEVDIEFGKITSWDEGWDSLGMKVWGAEGGGYVFKKLN
mgnify:CR=1 FL=1|jgi:CpeT protein